MKAMLLPVIFAVLGSCADVEPQQAAVPAPESKPAKTPPADRKPDSSKGSSKGIGMEEFFSLQQSGDALIYDVRDPYFYAIDHIPGAINWPHTRYDAQVRMRDTEIRKAQKEGKQVVLYCFNIGCPEARNVAKKLARRGYDVRVLTMGIDSWREAGLPLVTAG